MTREDTRTAANRKEVDLGPAPVRLRFFIDHPRIEAAALEHIAGDIKGAQLSVAFRAYYRLRQLIPLRARQFLQRRRRVETGDRWCFPDGFLESLIKAIEHESIGVPIIHPWPNGRRFAFVLTHDVDTEEGFRNVLRVANIEEELGFRSSWNVVPYKYRIDEGLIRDLQARSFEIGIHGYNHDGRLYASRREFERRACFINAALAKYRAVGFRSPMVHRNLEWLQRLDISYDASCFDADPHQAMPGGVGSIWPFVAGRFVELPYTLPQDHTLFLVRGETDGRIWERKRDYLVRQGGMLLMLTHPDYLTAPKRLDIYRRLLITTREIAGSWNALPKEVAQWWRLRQQSSVVRETNGDWSIQGPAAQAAVVASVEACDGHVSFRAMTSQPPEPAMPQQRGPLGREGSNASAASGDATALRQHRRPLKDSGQCR